MNEQKEQIPDWLCNYLRIAFLGEIYSNIRAIAIACNNKEDEITIRYYLDRNPCDYDYENLEVVATNLDALLPTQLKKLDIECIHWKDESLKNTDPLSGFFYTRKEYDLE